MIDRSLFFTRVRGTLFAGRLRQPQVDGMAGILNEWQHRGLTDPRWLAYMLATTRHETARTMQPIAEIGRGRGRRYGRPDPVTGQTYYGRGLVQLTWKVNYARAGSAVGADLVGHPERAMRPGIAVKILFDGMIDGWFAGDRAARHALPRWFNAGTNDPENARRIINGTDR
ncbi:MAG: glycoside hydrolase family 19 protein, partial [Alphaproteobacteria bacterium]